MPEIMTLIQNNLIHGSLELWATSGSHMTCHGGMLHLGLLYTCGVCGIGAEYHYALISAVYLVFIRMYYYRLNSVVKLDLVSLSWLSGRPVVHSKNY
jgi:hypothetical protein